MAQRHDWVWRNDTEAGRVFSTTCCGKAASPAAKPEPCLACFLLFNNKQFKNALQKPTPPDENYKFVNHEYRNKSLAVLYGRSVDLRPIIEAAVSKTCLVHGPLLTYYSQGLKETPLMKYT